MFSLVQFEVCLCWLPTFGTQTNVISLKKSSLLGSDCFQIFSLGLSINVALPGHLPLTYALFLSLSPIGMVPCCTQWRTENWELNKPFNYDNSLMSGRKYQVRRAEAAETSKERKRGFCDTVLQAQKNRMEN